jgi:uncharacterized protein (TIGR03435 family)
VLIELAYNVRDFQIQNLPSWGTSEKYEVIAKARDNATFEQMRPMLRSLLADRFQLALHRETRELPIYRLTIAKGGLRIVGAKEGSCITLDPDHPQPPPDPGKPHAPFCGGVVRMRNSIEAGAISMPKLSEILSDEVRRTVTDNTGFAEAFNLHLEFAPDLSANGPETQAGDSIFTALQNQMGLRLEATKGPVEVLEIDRAERPSGN